MIQLVLTLLCLLKVNAKSDTSCNSAYCSACSDANTCTNCINGYILEDGDCLWKEDLHCSSTYSYNSRCEICQSGYSLTYENKCISCPNLNGCERLVGTTCDSGCDYCKDNSYYSGTTNKCVNDDNFCDRYYSDGICRGCIDFYYLDDNKKCQKGNISHCIFYNGEDDCDECEGNFNFNETSKKCIECEIENCKSCSSKYSYMCKSCLTGYQLSNDKTICFKCNVKNCLTCVDELTDECSICNQGYYLNGVECDSVTSVNNCATYSTSIDECISCDKGYYLNENKCYKHSTVTNCYSYDNSADKCTSCESGYSLDDVDNTCQKCSDTNCFYCYDDINECTKCNKQFRLNTTTNTCDSCADENCLKCPEEVETCTSCKDGYFISEGICEKCNIDNCKECSNQTICSECTSGYTFHETKCVKCSDNNCGTCDENGICEECQKSYFINKDFTCGKCSDWCIHSPDDYYNSKCTHHASYCYVSEGTYDGCSMLASDGKTCIDCNEDYTLDRGKCYTYYKATGYDGIDYGCYDYVYDEIFEKRILEIFEPEDGECENPLYVEESGSSVVIISSLLITLLILNL